MLIYLLVCFVFPANPPEFNSLREGSNGGGGKDWKVKLLLLSIKSCTNVCSTAMIGTLQSSSLCKQEQSDSSANAVFANRKIKL